MSSAEPEEDGIVLLDFRGETYIRQCVVSYNKENPEIAIQYERKSNNEENWTRTMAQLSSGKGPDMIFMVSFDERVQTLYEKGVLMDLSNMLSEETLSQIFPGILAAGTIDETLVGICPQGLPIVFWTADSLWTEEWWSPADILTIVEENPQLEGLYVSDEGASPGSNLGFGVLNHVESSPYVDITKGVSYFEAEDFIKTLELAKRYGELPTVGGEEKVERSETESIWPQLNMFLASVFCRNGREVWRRLSYDRLSRTDRVYRLLDIYRCCACKCKNGIQRRGGRISGISVKPGESAKGNS